MSGTLDGMASTGEVWQLGHRPALDGLRGIAVLLVLTTHLRVPGFGVAPAVGVVIFFALSGFLITSLLLERDEPLRRFYARRAARLMPAMLTCLALYAALQLTIGGRIAEPHLVVGALTYSSNWVQAAGLYATDTGLGHMWSLAVEEQFYLLWPLVLLGLVRLPRRWALVAVAAAVAASLLARVALYGSEGYHRAYYGFDTRADELLIGCWLALLVSGRVERRAPGWLAVAALVAAVGLSWTPVPFDTVLMPTVVALLTAVVLWVGVNGSVWLPPRWLMWVGRRSYAIYLYHLPIRWAVEQYVDDWRVIAPTVAAATLLLAEVSWRVVEQPFLRHALHRQAAVAPVRSRVEVHARPAVLVHAEVDVLPVRERH